MLCFYKENLKYLMLKVTTVFVVLLSMFSCTLFTVSATSYAVPYATYTYKDISTICVNYFTDDPGHDEEIGDWTYSRVSGARPNKFIVSMKEAGSTSNTTFQFALRYDIGKIFEPGSYTFEFDIEPGVPSSYTFLGWNKLWYLIDNAVEVKDKTNPSLRTGDDTSDWYSVSMSQGSSSAGTKLWKGLLTLTFDKPTRVSNLSFIYPVQYTGSSNPSWNADAFIFFCSDLKITTYTDNPGAIQKYEPPDTSGVDDYAQSESQVQDFVGSSGADSYLDTGNLSTGIGDDALDSTFGISALLQYIHDKLPFVKNIVYISVSFGIVMLLFNLIPALTRSRKGG